jgi:glycosyltransferase involved in cell wall biosynthesis
MNKLSIIIPAYNEERTIAEIIKKIKALDIKIEKEIIVVDNNSIDKTYEIAKSFSEITLLKETVKGKGYAVKKGLEVATGEFILIQDADLEYNPQDIIKLIDKAAGKTVVYGSRNLGVERKGGILARFGVWFLTKEFNFLFNCNLTDLWTCYKLFPKEASILFKNGGFDSELSFSTSLIKNGFKIIETSISYNRPRTKAEGKKIRYIDGIKGIFLLISEKLKR